VRGSETLAAAAALIALASPAEAGERQRLNLPAGRLGDSVVALGRQANISIGIHEPKLAELKVPALAGRFSVEEALSRLLTERGARAVPLGQRTWLVVRSAAPAPVRIARRIVAAQRPEPRPAVAVDGGEVVVTGSKRRILLAAYPGAASVVEGWELELDGFAGSEALTARLPTVTSTHLGPGRNKLFIRGIADSSFNGPTQATVGQYFGETRLNYNAPDPDLRLYDIQRVEVLPGPQGTLYGAGSLGGVIRTIPNPARLDALEAAASLGASATEHGAPGAEAAAMLNVPLVEGGLGLRLVGYGESEGGYIDDPLRGRDDVNRTRTIGGRASLKAVPGEGWTVTLGLTGQRIRGEDAQFADRDGPPLTRRSRVRQDYTNSYLVGDLVVAKNWGDLRFVTATGVVRQLLDEHYDSSRKDGTPTLFEQRNRITMLSAESRLSRDGPNGTGWILGTSFIDNRSEQERALGRPGAPSPITGVRNAISEATAYGEATVRLLEGVNLTGGARLTRSRLSGAALDVPQAVMAQLARVQASRAQTSFRPSFALTVEAAPALLLFGRYQQGFRPGGLAVTGELIQRFRSDSVSTAEAGLRYGPSGGFEASASAAYTRWKDIQADIIDFAGLPTTSNIGNGRIYTLDLKLGWRPVPGLALEAAAVLNESKVTNPVAAFAIAPSAELPNVARVNARLGAEWRRAVSPGLDLHVTASARYVGKSRLGIGPVLGEEQGDWLDARVGVRLEGRRHALSLGTTNLLDEKGNRFAFGSPFTLLEQRQITPLRPRTVRVGWELRF
jgi:iron complex outermembrane receptor protein